MAEKALKIPQLKVLNFMITNPLHTTPNAKISQTELLMLRKKIGGLPVVRESTKKELIGIITQRDIRLARFAMNLDTPNTHVSDLMTPDPIVVRKEDPLLKVLQLMHENNIERLPVVNERSELIGLVIEHDILTAIYSILKV
jgi:IMP dehydrogenase